MRLQNTVKFSAFYPLNSHNQLSARCLRLDLKAMAALWFDTHAAVSGIDKSISKKITLG
jgi:hypothetical protein